MWSAQQSFNAFYKIWWNHTFSVIFMLSANVWKNSAFLKSNKGLPCTVGLVSSSFKLIWSHFSKGRWQIFSISKNYMTFYSYTNFWFFHHLVLITQHALSTVNRSIEEKLKETVSDGDILKLTIGCTRKGGWIPSPPPPTLPRVVYNVET